MAQELKLTVEEIADLQLLVNQLTPGAGRYTDRDTERQLEVLKKIIAAQSK